MENTFENIAKEMVALQKRKNHDYGNAYYENLEDEQLAAARIAIGNKWRRFKHLSAITDKGEVNESLEDTLIDMASYALMTIQWMREHGKEI